MGWGEVWWLVTRIWNSGQMKHNQTLRYGNFTEVQVHKITWANNVIIQVDNIPFIEDHSFNMQVQIPILLLLSLEMFLRHVRTLCVALRIARNSPVHRIPVINCANAIHLFRPVLRDSLKNLFSNNSVLKKPNMLLIQFLPFLVYFLSSLLYPKQSQPFSVSISTTQKTIQSQQKPKVSALRSQTITLKFRLKRTPPGSISFFIGEYLVINGIGIKRCKVQTTSGCQFRVKTTSGCHQRCEGDLW